MARLKLIALASGEEHEMAGQYVVSYDPQYHHPDGSYDGGNLVCTGNPDEAGDFTPAQAIKLWRSGPTCKCHRMRLDGQPNRPLTAFTISME